MSGSTRSTRNPPDYYFKLTTKQQRNWRRNARREERNEELRNQYSPYRPTSNIRVVHLHHRTDLHTIEQLIERAKRTTRYTIDTESTTSRHGNQGAIVQIEIIEAVDRSTMVLLEAAHLPAPSSLHLARIEEFWSVVFDRSNEIITWGTLHDELKDFQHINWMKIGNSRPINLQLLFQEWRERKVTHPETERRGLITGISNETPGDLTDEEDFDVSHGKPTTAWSLQSAVATALRKFLDKTETINQWNCDLDSALETWRRRTCSRRDYDVRHEQQHRRRMVDYAIHDCTSVTELYFMVCAQPVSAIHSSIEATRPAAIASSSMETPARTPANSINSHEHSLDTSEEEFNKIRFPVFASPAPKPTTTDQDTDVLVLQAPRDEEFTHEDGRTEEARRTETPKAKPSKGETQRRKSAKLKWKQKNRPNFKHRIKRPIFYRYDYRKIRSQLRDDDIHTSHQLTINRERSEAIIGFKSQEEQQRATAIVKINYFSRDQYVQRWGAEPPDERRR